MLTIDAQGFIIKTDANPPFRLPIKIVNGQFQFFEKNKIHARARASDYVHITTNELEELIDKIEVGEKKDTRHRP